MPSSKFQAVSSFNESEISAPFTVILAIMVLRGSTLEHDCHERWVRVIQSYLIDGVGLSVEQHAERILKDCTRLGPGERVLLPSTSLSQKRLGDVSTVADCESRGTGCGVSFVNKTQLAGMSTGDEIVEFHLPDTGYSFTYYTVRWTSTLGSKQSDYFCINATIC